MPDTIKLTGFTLTKREMTALLTALNERITVLAEGNSADEAAHGRHWVREEIACLVAIQQRINNAAS